MERSRTCDAPSLVHVLPAHLDETRTITSKHLAAAARQLGETTSVRTLHALVAAGRLPIARLDLLVAVPPYTFCGEKSNRTPLSYTSYSIHLLWRKVKYRTRIIVHTSGHLTGD